MSILLDILQQLSLADSAGSACISNNSDSVCPSSAFHAVTAALATQGYWLQAYFLHLFDSDGLSAFAALVYVFGAVGALIGTAFGMPPKLYLWFFMGPAVFHWLIATPWAAQGVRWDLVSKYQSIDPNSLAAIRQKEVWRIAEPGLSAMKVVTEGGYKIGSIKNSLTGEPLAPDDGNGKFGIPGSGTVNVSFLFGMYDWALSSIIHQTMNFLGVYETDYWSKIGGKVESLARLPGAAISALDPTGTFNLSSNTQDNLAPLWLISDLKWPVLENITTARIQNPDLRDLFVNFLGSECGDRFYKKVDKGAYAAALSSNGGNGPFSIFPNEIANKGYAQVEQSLANMPPIPMPRALLNLKDDEGAGGFRVAMGYYPFRDDLKTINCADLLRLIVAGFRWEAGHQAYQMVAKLPDAAFPAAFLYSFFRSWMIPDFSSGLSWSNLAEVIQDFGVVNSSKFPIDGLLPPYQGRFFTDLVFVHLVRNEMEAAPRPLVTREAATGQEIRAVEVNQRTVFQKNEFGKVYSWALMLPNIQGLLLYYLAAIFPFAACFILIPGKHKTLMTWFAFWTWVKLWDVGFAIVKMIEPTIWASVGSGANAAGFLSRVRLMQSGPLENLAVNLYCNKTTTPTAYDAGLGGIGSGIISGVQKLVGGWDDLVRTVAGAFVAGDGQIPLASGCGSGSSLTSVPTVVVANASGELPTFSESLRLLDLAISFGSGSKLDLANSNYIYIMAALYFAVPAVIGQLVLAGKAGLGAAISGMADKIGGEVGRASGQDFMSALKTNIDNNKAAMLQSKAMSEMRSGPLADKYGNWLNSANHAADVGAREKLFNLLANGNSNLQGHGQLINGHINEKYGTALNIADPYYQLKSQETTLAGTLGGGIAGQALSVMPNWAKLATVAGAAYGYSALPNKGQKEQDYQQKQITPEEKKAYQSEIETFQSQLNASGLSTPQARAADQELRQASKALASASTKKEVLDIGKRASTAVDNAIAHAETHGTPQEKEQARGLVDFMKNTIEEHPVAAALSGATLGLAASGLMPGSNVKDRFFGSSNLNAGNGASLGGSIAGGIAGVQLGRLRTDAQIHKLEQNEGYARARTIQEMQQFNNTVDSYGASFESSAAGQRLNRMEGMNEFLLKDELRYSLRDQGLNIRQAYGGLGLGESGGGLPYDFKGAAASGMLGNNVSNAMQYFGSFSEPAEQALGESMFVRDLNPKMEEMRSSITGQFVQQYGAGKRSVPDIYQEVTGVTMGESMGGPLNDAAAGLGLGLGDKVPALNEIANQPNTKLGNTIAQGGDELKKFGEKIKSHKND